MTHRQVGGLGLVDVDVERVSTGGVEEPVAHHRANRVGGQDRLGNEAVDRAKDRRSIQAIARHDVERRVEGKMSDEYREPAKHHAFHSERSP